MNTHASASSHGRPMGASVVLMRRAKLSATSRRASMSLTSRRSAGLAICVLPPLVGAAPTGAIGDVLDRQPHPARHRRTLGRRTPSVQRP